MWLCVWVSGCVVCGRVGVWVRGCAVARVSVWARGRGHGRGAWARGRVGMWVWGVCWGVDTFFSEKISGF